MTASGSAAATAVHRLGRAEDIPRFEGRTATVAGVSLAVFSTEHGFVAIGAACPHQGGPLADGIVSERCVTCPLHNRRIDLHTGEVVAGGEGRVPAYEVVERDGDLYVPVSGVDGTPLEREPLEAAA